MYYYDLFCNVDEKKWFVRDKSRNQTYRVFIFFLNNCVKNKKLRAFNDEYVNYFST